MVFYKEHIHSVLKALHTSENGLSDKEAKRRLDEQGLNAIKLKGTPLWRKIIEPFWNVFMAVLILAGLISIFQGAVLDAVIVLVIVMISAIIYYVQQFSTERILRALKQQNTQMTEVIRGGKTQKIASELLVSGDIIVLSEGEKVPADARVLHARSVRVDEALLTGESAPVTKQTHPLEGDKQVYEQSNILFQGSFIISGEVRAIVVATGNKTEFGQLAALSQNTDITSPVQKKIDKLLTQIMIVIAAVALLALGLALFRGMELADALRFVLTLSVSAVPEGLPVAITVVLVLGMRRMAKRRALVRNMRAIEAVGVITTIATDKTGTLTKNILSVRSVWQPAISNVDMTQLILLSTNAHSGKMHDPLDTAFHGFAVGKKAETPKDYTHEISLPFNQSFAMSGNIWRHDREYTLYVKGAPEYILHHTPLTSKQHEAILHELHQLTSRGFRVIALATAKLAKPFENFQDMLTEHLTFAGFVAVSDTLRPEAKRAIAAAHKAGVSVRMITGDHFETAYSIGKELGMVEHRDQVFDSRNMAVLSDKKLEKIVHHARIFSRVIPEHKYRILNLLKQKDITAMTGDGVNDVPALANAHVGVAMGSGSQIAKEAGDIVLLDNNFKSIIEAMREGRIIFSNIRRMLFYLLATSSGEVLTMLGALVIGIPLPVAAIQILWINLVTDTAMVIPLGLEAGEKDIMTTKPRHPRQAILGKFIVSRILLIALSMAIIALTTFFTFWQMHGIDYARTITFNVLVVMQWANAFNARSELESIFTRLKTINYKFIIGFGLGFSLQMLALFSPLQSLLHVAPVAIGDIAITSFIGIAVIISVSELHKLIGRKF
jgi:P-type Ca2+ transporter type 2C